MQMQTGPAPRQSMRSWLIWTGLLEWFNVALAGWFLWYLSGRYEGLVGPFVVLGYLTLALFLIEGAATGSSSGGAGRRWVRAGCCGCCAPSTL